jgi:hypothetical protein
MFLESKRSKCIVVMGTRQDVPGLARFDLSSVFLPNPKMIWTRSQVTTVRGIDSGYLGIVRDEGGAILRDHN